MNNILAKWTSMTPISMHLKSNLIPLQLIFLPQSLSPKSNTILPFSSSFKFKLTLSLSSSISLDQHFTRLFIDLLRSS